MIFYFLYLLVLISVVKSDDDFDESIWRDINNNTINVNEYCANKNCVVKCCPMGRLVVGNKCVRPKKTAIAKLLNYSDIDVYNWDSASSKLINTKKKFYSHFVFIHNDYFFNLRRSYPFPCNATLLQDGSVQQWDDLPSLAKLTYCVDYMRDPRGNKVGRFNFTARGPIYEDKEIKIKHYYVATGMLISSFFMLLVLLVYSVLPTLRNIVGKTLMAYLISFTCAYVLKAIQIIGGFVDGDVCRTTSPAVYYFVMASFFWLNVMSFDLFWTIRGTRKSRDIHRQGELVKFFWYCVYAWGTSIVMTLSIVYIQRFDVVKNRDYIPPFDTCFTNQFSTAIYLHIPIGIITIANIIMFMLTAYNVWLVKRAIRNTKDNRTKNSENRFVIYINLFVWMGVGWILELVPNLPLVPYIIVNFFNMFIGVIIFIIFVCKRSTILMLCKRFDIKNSFVDKLMSPQSENTKSSHFSRTHRSYMDTGDATELTLNAPEP